jgi:hypothetical protein
MNVDLSAESYEIYLKFEASCKMDGEAKILICINCANHDI